MYFIRKVAILKVWFYELTNFLLMSSFEEYLILKNIDWRKFGEAEPGRYAEFKSLFETIHSDSFTAQKKFLINDLRRQYMLKDPNEKIVE